LLKALDEVMVEDTAGDPISGLKWSHKSLRKIQTALDDEGYAISPPTISRLLQARDYSLQVNHKRLAGKQSPGRDEQFRYLVRWRQAFLRRYWPVISVDAKKREQIGNFKNAGCAWRKERREVNLYDFPSLAQGIAIPYGIYDIGQNQGFVSVGTSHNTPEFAITTIRLWWLMMGQLLYPDQKYLLIEADCGSSNGNRSRVWKMGLQLLADEFDLIITVTHYPTGASKWNPIEHQMFNLISANWAGEPLDSYETILNHIRTTTSTTGFCCQAQLDTTDYKLKQKISDQDFAGLHLRPHKRFPKWNYTIYPRTPKPVV
jgi:Rhodopirellula transposase DDE domain